MWNEKKNYFLSQNEFCRIKKRSEKEEKLETTIDRIRDQFGFLAVQKASSLLENSRVIARSRLVGGHSAGGLEGLK